MNKLNPEMVKDINIVCTVNVWAIFLEFIIVLADVCKLKSSDILEFLGIHQEKDPKKIQLKLIAEKYAFFNDEEKELSKCDEQFSHLDFNQIEVYSNEYLEKIKRFEEFENNFLSFFTSLNNSHSVYKKGCELISLAIDEDYEIVLNSDLALLIELIKKIGIKIQEETVQGFFFTKLVKTALNNINMLSFMKIVNRIIQKELSKN